MDWECGDLNTNISGVPVCKWLVPPSELRERYTDPTLMSTMVWLSLVSDGAATSSDAIGAFGIIVVSAFDDNNPTGVACPSPINDCDADWVYLNYATTVIGSVGQVSMDTELDRRSQAKRRLGNDKGILLVFDSLNQDYNGHAHIRCLIKE
jgi:hypothetical protein